MQLRNRSGLCIRATKLLNFHFSLLCDLDRSCSFRKAALCDDDAESRDAGSAQDIDILNEI
jgi:hypothetical protein